MFSSDQSPVHGSPRHGILSLSIKDLEVLHAAYMPFLENGGLFIPTDKQYDMGDEVFMLLKLMDEVEKIPVAGTVVWITPANPQTNRAPGVGVQFKDVDNPAKTAIENHLAARLGSDQPTHTL